VILKQNIKEKGMVKRRKIYIKENRYTLTLRETRQPMEVFAPDFHFWRHRTKAQPNREQVNLPVLFPLQVECHSRHFGRVWERWREVEGVLE
jgi:hypothetical protein